MIQYTVIYNIAHLSPASKSMASFRGFHSWKISGRGARNLLKGHGEMMRWKDLSFIGGCPDTSIVDVRQTAKESCKFHRFSYGFPFGLPCLVGMLFWISTWTIVYFICDAFCCEVVRPLSKIPCMAVLGSNCVILVILSELIPLDSCLQVDAIPQKMDKNMMAWWKGQLLSNMASFIMKLHLCLGFCLCLFLLNFKAISAFWLFWLSKKTASHPSD